MTPRHETLEEYRLKRERKKELERQQQQLRNLDKQPLPPIVDNSPEVAQAKQPIPALAPVCVPANITRSDLEQPSPPLPPSAAVKQLPTINVEACEDGALSALSEHVRSSTTTPVLAHVDYPSPFGTLRNSRNFQ